MEDCADLIQSDQIKLTINTSMECKSLQKMSLKQLTAITQTHQTHLLHGFAFHTSVNC